MKRLIHACVVFLIAAAAAIGQTPVIGLAPVPIVVAILAPSTYSGTTGISAITLVTASDSTSIYRACGWASMTVAGTAGTFVLQPIFTSDTHTYFETMASLPANTQWARAGNCFNIYPDIGTTIQWSLVATGVTGSPTVRYFMTLEKLQ